MDKAKTQPPKIEVHSRFVVRNGHGLYYCDHAWNSTMDNPIYVFKATPESAKVFTKREQAEVEASALRKWYLSIEQAREAKGEALDRPPTFRDSDLTRVDIVDVTYEDGKPTKVNGMERPSEDQIIASGRHELYVKYGGRCALCGCQISEKKMRVVHIIPKPGTWTLKTDARDLNDDPNNMLPACYECYRFKRDMSLDEMKAAIEKLRHDLLWNTNNGRIAKQYEIVTPTDKPVIFYFESPEYRNMISGIAGNKDPNERK